MMKMSLPYVKDDESFNSSNMIECILYHDSRQVPRVLITMIQFLSDSGENKIMKTWRDMTRIPEFLLLSRLFMHHFHSMMTTLF